jgi:hypothetical protein
MAGLSVVHVNQALTNVSVAYRNAAFVSERVFPVVPVQKQNDVYFQFSKQHFLALPDTLRPGDEANEIEVDLDARGSYRCDGHGIQTAIPDETRAQADPGADLDIEYTQKVTEKILLNQEVNLAAQMTTSNITNNTTLSGTSKWSDYVNSNPITAIDAAKETVQQSIGEFPNVLLLPRSVYRTVRNHPQVLDRIKYTRDGARHLPTPEELADLFDVDEVIVPAPLQQANPEGEADSLQYIWGNLALLFYRPVRPGIRTPSFGYTFMWVAQGTSYMVKKFRIEGRDSDYIKAKKYYDQHFVASNAAYLWVTPV